MDTTDLKDAPGQTTQNLSGEQHPDVDREEGKKNEQRHPDQS
jgi:hypothetical protein